MKTCPYCKIEVGGDPASCPLCQNRLTGSPEEAPHWPAPTRRQHSVLLKIQLFAVLSAIIIVFLFDIWADSTHTITWSPLAIMYLIIGEITLVKAVTAKHTPIGLFTLLSIAGILTLILSSFWFPRLIGVIPIPLICVLGMNFVMTLIDRSGGMLYFICSFATGIISWIVVIVLMKSELAILWRICFMVSLVTLLGTLIFRGRALITEVRKRFFL